jgi:hypothetical protein
MDPLYHHRNLFFIYFFITKTGETDGCRCCCSSEVKTCVCMMSLSHHVCEIYRDSTMILIAFAGLQYWLLENIASNAAKEIIRYQTSHLFVECKHPGDDPEDCIGRRHRRE